MIEQRIKKAMNKEVGIRLSAIDVRRLGNLLGINPVDTNKAPLKKPSKPEKREPIDCHIRWMIRRDLPEVQAIEDVSFDDPWTEKEFIRSLRQRNCIGMVAEHDDRVLGFMLYELHKNLLTVLDFAVHPEFRYQTIATQMVNKLKGKLSKERRNTITLRVVDKNVDAMMFFQAVGFVATGCIRGHFAPDEDGIHQDAIEMSYSFEGKYKPFTTTYADGYTEWRDPDRDDDDDDVLEV